MAEQEQEKPFQPIGQPLPIEALNQKLIITLADVQNAVTDAGKLKPFLKAKISDK